MEDRGVWRSIYKWNRMATFERSACSITIVNASDHSRWTQELLDASKTRRPNNMTMRDDQISMESRGCLPFAIHLHQWLPACRRCATRQICQAGLPGRSARQVCRIRQLCHTLSELCFMRFELAVALHRLLLSRTALPRTTCATHEKQSAQQTGGCQVQRSHQLRETRTRLATADVGSMQRGTNN